MREVAGDTVVISKETIDWVNECAGGKRWPLLSNAYSYSSTDWDAIVLAAGFLQLIGHMANEVAEKAATKENYRISHEHVITALEVACCGWV